MMYFWLLIAEEMCYIWGLHLYKFCFQNLTVLCRLFLVANVPSSKQVSILTLKLKLWSLDRLDQVRVGLVRIFQRNNKNFPKCESFEPFVVCLHTCLCVPISLSLCVYVCLSVCLSASLSLWLSVSRSIVSISLSLSQLLYFCPINS